MKRRAIPGPIQARLLAALADGPLTARDLTAPAQRCINGVRAALRGPLRRGAIVQVGALYCLPDSPTLARLKAERALHPRACVAPPFSCQDNAHGGAAMSARFRLAGDWGTVLLDAASRGLTAPQLAAEIGCRPITVYAQAKARGVRLTSRYFRSYDWDRVFADAPPNETLNAFCRRAGCSAQAAQTNAAKRGHVFYKRTRQERAKGRWAARFAESRQRRETRTQFCVRFGVGESWAQEMADRLGHVFAPRVRTKRTAQWAKSFARAAERAP